MSSLTVAASSFSSFSLTRFAHSSSNNSLIPPKVLKVPLNANSQSSISFKSSNTPSIYRFPSLKTCAALDGKDPNGATPVLVEEESSTSSNIVNEEVEKSVKVLKNAAKTRKVPAEEVLSAFSVLEKAKLDPSKFFNTLGGTSSPGRTWMLIFTAEY